MDGIVNYLYKITDYFNHVKMEMVKNDKENESPCPICFDDIPVDSSNSLKTSCNHKFHTSCFLKHTAVNGYTCPYCRKVLVETTDTDDTEETNNDRAGEIFIHNHSLLEEGFTYREPNNEDTDDEDDEDEEETENNNIYDVDPENAMLAPMRWMFQRANDEPLEEPNPNLQRFYQYNDSKNRSMTLMREENWMYIRDMLQRLKKQKITEEQILAAYLYQVSHEYRFCTVAFDVNVDLQKKIHYLNTFSAMAGNGGYYSYDGEEE